MARKKSRKPVKKTTKRKTTAKRKAVAKKKPARKKPRKVPVTRGPVTKEVLIAGPYVGDPSVFIRGGEIPPPAS
jgi:hypothetical protein